MKNFKNNFNTNLMKWVSIIFLIIVAYNLIDVTNVSNKKLIFSDFLDKVSNGDVSEVSIKGSNIEGVFSNGEHFITLSPRVYSQLIDDLRARNVKINIVPLESTMSNILGIIFSWLPMIVLIGIWIYYLKNMQGAGGKAMGFGKSKAKLMQDQGKKVTFADVAGIDEAKNELKEVVDFLKDPGKFDKLGGKIPKGCLLIGSPGTGKTLLARAVAGEAGVPFFTISGSDFVEMFVGVGASRVRDMFTQAKKHAPCIVFIDEIDAVGRHRGSGYGGGNDEREQTLNQLLVEMDGFADNQGIIVVAATNRPDVLDSALLRPGRFDRQITVPVPDIKGREQILSVHIKKVPIAPNVDIKVIARGTPGFSGADLANLVNEAALAAAQVNRDMVTMHELEHAKDKVMMGAERKSMVMSEEEKKITAYHEGGHALVSLYVSESDPIHKATIIPRGRALGMVTQLPESDRCHHNKAYLEARLIIAMGGRVAEEIIFGKEKITTGASNDIKVATSLARNMITKWGFSEKIGPVMVGEDKEDGARYDVGSNKEVSEKLAESVDKEVDKLLRDSYKLAKNIIIKHKKKLEVLAKALMEYETITGDEIKDLIAGKKIRTHENSSNKNDDNRPTSSIPGSNLDSSSPVLQDV
jgi:cell division protease FtsH